METQRLARTIVLICHTNPQTILHWGWTIHEQQTINLQTN